MPHPTIPFLALGLTNVEHRLRTVTTFSPVCSAQSVRTCPGPSCGAAGRSFVDVMTGSGCWRPDTDAADEDVPLLAAVALLSAMHVPAHADSISGRHHTTGSATFHQSVVAFEEAVYSGCGLPSLESVTLLLDAVLLEASAGLDGQTRVVGTMRILARALRQFYVLRGGGDEGCVGGPALLCSSNWRLLLLASVLLASKFAEDEYAEPSTNHFSAHAAICRARVPTPIRSHIELVSLHKIAALGLPVGVHPPSCDQIASAEIALLRLLEWHAGFHVGELSRQRMHLVRLAEQARRIKHTKHSSTGPTQQPACMCYSVLHLPLVAGGGQGGDAHSGRPRISGIATLVPGRSDVAVVQPVHVEQQRG